MPDTCLKDCIRDALCLVVCEGGAEEAVVEMLLQENALIFDRDDMVDKEVSRKRRARDIETAYLNMEYGKRVVILRILDSRSDTFSLGKAYRERFEVYNIYTRPEIEMLLIHSERKYKEYVKSKSKRIPSQFCAEELFPKQHFKQKSFWHKHFQDRAGLVRAIQEYHRTKHDKREYDLSDLLKDTLMT